MKERDKAVATGLVALMLILWLGFLVHRSPRFAGSLWGGVFGVGGALLMLFPLAYLIVKRVKWIKGPITKYVSMRTLLTWHIYAGILGPILVLIHSGHKFESVLGITLTTMTIVVVLSGFIGRYMMSQFSKEIREKKAMLTQLQTAYQRASFELQQRPAQAKSLRSFSGMLMRPLTSFLLAGDTGDGNALAPGTVIQLSESIADVEYAVKTHETFKRWFGKWLKFHIVISFILYFLMTLHIWSAVHFGLRWFDSWSPVISNQRPMVAQALPDSSEDFSRYFGRLFARHWRQPVTIHGIQTTVFDYAALSAEAKRSDSDFSRALSILNLVDPASFQGGNREKAFWLNMYNFGAMKLAAEYYPVDSITNPRVSATGDPWGKKIVRIGNNDYSLSQIEKEILIPKFGDPRIVFAVSCAAVSCPDRPQHIFASGELDQQLDDLISAFLANPKKGMLLDRDNKLLTLSWIFKADKHLFGDDAEIVDFIAQYTPAETTRWLQANRTGLRLEFFEHDWTLNDIAQAEKQN